MKREDKEAHSFISRLAFFNISSRPVLSEFVVLFFAAVANFRSYCSIIFMGLIFSFFFSFHFYTSTFIHPRTDFAFLHSLVLSSFTYLPSSVSLSLFLYVYVSSLFSFTACRYLKRDLLLLLLPTNHRLLFVTSEVRRTENRLEFLNCYSSWLSDRYFLHF